MKKTTNNKVNLSKINFNNQLDRKQNNRRDLLKHLGITAAWSTPVVTSVILPAHAQTSLTENNDKLSCQVDLLSLTPTSPAAINQNDSIDGQIRVTVDNLPVNNIIEVEMALRDPNIVGGLGSNINFDFLITSSGAYTIDISFLNNLLTPFDPKTLVITCNQIQNPSTNIGSTQTTFPVDYTFII